MATPEAENLTMKQRIFIGVLGVLSVLLAALVVFYFSPTEETGEAFPGRNLSPAVYEAGFGRHSTPTDIFDNGELARHPSCAGWAYAAKYGWSLCAVRDA